MSCVYVTEQGAKVSVGEGKLIIECKNNQTRYIPIETIESLVVFGNIYISLGAQKALLERGISTSILSTHGRYFGRLINTASTNAERFKRQVYLSDNEEQCLLLAKKTLASKVHNQFVVARRYIKQTTPEIDEKIKQIQLARRKIYDAGSIEEVLGFEGTAAKIILVYWHL